MIGRTVSHYQVIERLGSGGMGEIYKAQDSRLNRMVAIKVLSRRAAALEEQRRRFIKEAQAASSLNHPNIITIYDIVSDEDNEYMVMEYVAGKTLTELIPEGGASISKALDYGVQIADALSTAHAAGIVHRDLKPGNVMVTASGRVKILDFGLAKMTVPAQFSEDTETIGAAPLTTEGSIIGTVSYMSPEQAEGKRVDARSDVFSFGALMYELITGRKAFLADSAVSTMTAILRDDVRPVRDLVPDAPRELEEIIARALRKDPAQRWQSVQEVHSILAAVRQKYESGVLMPPIASRKRSPWRMAGGVFAIVAAIGAGWIFSRRPAPKVPAASLPAILKVEPAPVQPPPAASPAPAPTPPAPKKVEKAAAAKTEPKTPSNVLTNKSVIDMAQAKVSPALIMSLIRSSKTRFDMSVPEIIKLTKAGVPDEVIEVMRDPTAPPKPAPGPEPPPQEGRGGRRDQRVIVDLGRAMSAVGTHLPFPTEASSGSIMVYGGLPVSLTLVDDIPLDPPAGMPLHFQVDQDLRLGPNLIVAKGAAASGEIVIPGGQAKERGAGAAFKLISVTAADGSKMKIRASPGRNTDRNQRPVATLGYKYKEVLAPAGTRYIGFIDNDQPFAAKK
jgi:serine/threonine-protein kinase